MDLTELIGRRRLREQDAMRILIILYELGSPASAGDIHCTLDTEVYLQKLDYLVRNPADLAYVLVDQYSRRPQQLTDYREELIALIRHLALEKEPRLRTMGMQKFRFGPWEKLDDIMAYLRSRDLVLVRPRTGLKRGLRYLLTSKGADLVRRLYQEVPETRYYAEKCQVIKKFLSHLRGTRLKDYLYDVLQRIEEARLGQSIPSHADLVPPRFAEVFGQPL